MADGVGTGIGIGIGNALGDIGDAIRARRDRAREERDKQASDIHTKGMGIAHKLLESGYSTKMDPEHGAILIDTKGNPVENAPPEISNLFDQFIDTARQGHELYRNDPNGFVEHFKKFIGGKLGQPTYGKQAEQFSLGGLTSEAQALPDQQYTGEAGQFQQLAKLATDPRQSPETRAAAKARMDQLGQVGDFEKIGEPKLDKTTNRYYQTYASKSDPTKQKTVRLPMDFQPTGQRATEQKETLAAGKETPDETIASEAKLWTDSGVAPPAKDRGRVEAFLAAHGQAPQAKPDNSPQGRLAKALVDSGKATADTANQKAASMIVEAQNAKQKAASGTSSMSPEELKALAEFDFISGNRTAFGLGKSSDRDAYNRARADLALQGQGGSLLGGRADIKSTQTALTRLQGVYNQTLVNEKNATKNFALLKNLGARMDQESFQTAVPILNEWLRTGQIALTGNPAVNNYMSTLATTMTEYAKVVTGQTGGAAVTDAARHEMQQILNRGLSTATVNDWIDNAAGPDMANRASSYADTISGLQDQIKNVPSGGPTPKESAPGSLDDALDKAFGKAPAKK